MSVKGFDGEIIKPKTFKVDGIDGFIKYSYYHANKLDNLHTLNVEFLIKDAFGYCRDITYIELIQIDEERCKGSGSKLLQAFLKEHKDEFIILNAAATDEETYNNNLDAHLNMLSNFYIKNGFIDINNIIGFYEESIAFGYDSDLLRECLSRRDYE